MAPLALLDDPSFGEPCVYACNAEPLKRRAGGGSFEPGYMCEAAGAEFARRYDTAAEGSDDAGAGRKGGKRRGNEDSDSDAGEQYKAKGKDKSGSGKGFMKLSDRIKGMDLYKLLDTSEGASQEEIKKAYRALALVAHPDKQIGKSEEESKEIQEHFVKIQEAYEILSEPATRMQYDSSLDFDESLPRFKNSEGQNFYEMFGECFKRNARFSVKRPVPDIGDAETKPEVWKKFYDFWQGFQSWRDPVVMADAAGEEICDLNDAECREEKRWMMKENDRVAKKYKKAERERMCDLVRLAEKYDPRIQAEKDAKKAAKDADLARKADEKMAGQRAKEEVERKRKEEEDRIKAAEQEKKAAEKAVKEAAKMELKKCRQRVRSFHPKVQKFVLIDQLNEVCLRWEEAALRKLGDDVEAALKKSPSDAAGVMHQAIESCGIEAVLKVEDDLDTASTSGGSPSSQEPEEDPAVVRKRQAEQKKRDAAAKKAREAQEKVDYAERAEREEAKAVEKQKRDEQRRKEQSAADAARRQQDKKEEQKAKKALDQKAKKEQEAALQKEMQREEAREAAAAQAQYDREQAAEKQAEQEMERIANLFTNDRVDRLAKLDAATDDDLTAVLNAAAEEDLALKGALKSLKKMSEEITDEETLDRAMSLVYELGPIWVLGLVLDPEIRLPNNVRNKAKRAKNRLQSLMEAFLATAPVANADETAASEWQQGIVDGSVETVVYSVEHKDAEDQAAQAAIAAAVPAGKKKKAGKAKAAEEDEDLDKLLAEIEAPSKGGVQGGKKGKKGKK